MRWSPWCGRMEWLSCLASVQIVRYPCLSVCVCVCVRRNASGAVLCVMDMDLFHGIDGVLCFCLPTLSSHNLISLLSRISIMAHLLESSHTIIFQST
mmetsp:Transcript_20195/g.31573  ORF Transcript_20195/g.31573 Transcript_20195/m.31573 type:complete len:97 (-) Transcript_20195:46-336(-)